MKIRYYKEKFFLFLLLFFWFFSPVVNILGVIQFKTYIVTVIIPAIIGFTHYFKYTRQSKISNLILVMMLFGFIYILVAENIGLLNGIIDFSFAKDYIIGFAIFFSAYYIVMQYKKVYQEDFRQKLLLHIFYVGVVHSMLIILVAALPSFREWFYSLIWTTEKQSRYIFGDVFNRRYSGLLDTGFASLSAIHATVLSIGIYYLYEFKSKIKSLNIYLLYFLLIFISLIFIGHTGFVVLAAYLFTLCVVYTVYIFKNAKISLSLIKAIVYG